MHAPKIQNDHTRSVIYSWTYHYKRPST